MVHYDLHITTLYSIYLGSILTQSMDLYLHNTIYISDPNFKISIRFFVTSC